MKAVAIVAAAVVRLAAGAPNALEDPSVNAVNRLPAHTYAMPLASERDALTDELEPETPYRISLNGKWRLSWAGRPQDRVKDFWKPDFDDSRWFEIDVPSCVELRGFGCPGYTNIRYPHADLSHPTNAAFAAIRDRQSGSPDYNPVSSYRRTFTVPESWKGRRVILRFDGVYSAYYVWVNGQKVGYAEDSKLPSEFDITEYLGDQGSGIGDQRSENVLAVEVYRWCDGSYLEDQDMFRFSGIFRDVTMWSMPKDGIWDFAVRTTPDGGYERWKVEVEVDGGIDSVAIYDADKKKVGELTPLSTSTFSLDLAPRMWSAEKPYLYTLVLKKGDDIRMKRIGFKEQRIVGNALVVNGRKIKLKGVNRHETSPENGRTVTVDEMVRDIVLMKRFNIDTVRTSHYPNHRLWYDLCDRYGIYLCAEANVEGHEAGFRENGLGRFAAWDAAIVERNVRQVLFYRNHPSVTMWSMGNETGHGDCFRHAISEVRKADPTRPIHWNPGNSDADIDSRMYPSVDWLEKRGRYGDGLTTDFADEEVANDEGARQSPGKPFFVCEYAHAMGNALGNFTEYWDVIYRYDSLAGGCIWDWADQAIWKYTDRIDSKTGRRERFLAYGGDFDELPNDGPFCNNGLVGPLRDVSAKLVEVGHVHRNLVVTRRGAGALDLWNRFAFTWADEFEGRWTLVEDGRETAGGAFLVPHLAPLSHGPLKIDCPRSDADGKERFLNVSFHLKSETAWGRKGWAVARDQILLNEAAHWVGAAASGQAAFAENAREVAVSSGGTKIVLSRDTGTLCELVMDGRVILKDPEPGIPSGPLLTCERAFTDNDIWLRQRESRKKGQALNFYTSGLTQLRHHVRPIEIRDGCARVVTEVTGMKSAGFTHEAVWRVAEDGTVYMKNVVTPHGVMPSALPRLGLSLKLDKSLEAMRYYGRGPRENYIDRKSGSFFGIWESTVTDQYEPYVRPQDNGFKCDVRWIEFCDGDGQGVRFSASEPLFVQALHYGLEDLEFARHRKDQQRFRSPLVPREEVCLNLDIRQLGLGGNSCGPGPIWGKYVFPIQREEWTLKIEKARLRTEAAVRDLE